MSTTKIARYSGLSREQWPFHIQSCCILSPSRGQELTNSGFGISKLEKVSKDGLYQRKGSHWKRQLPPNPVPFNIDGCGETLDSAATRNRGHLLQASELPPSNRPIASTAPVWILGLRTLESLSHRVYHLSLKAAIDYFEQFAAHDSETS